MSRKKQAPKRIFYPDPKYGSLLLAKFINFVMYDGKKTTSEKIIYPQIKKILRKWNIDIKKSFMLGDKLSDKQAANKSGLYFEYVKNDFYLQIKKISQKY